MPRRSLPSLEDARRIIAATRTRPARKAAPPVGRALTPFIKALDERFGQGAGALQARWREIVGETLASRTEPAKLVKGRGGQPGTLEIRVQGPAASLIQHQSPGQFDPVLLQAFAACHGELERIYHDLAD